MVSSDDESSDEAPVKPKKKKPRKPKARRVVSSDDESSDEAPVKPKKKKPKQGLDAIRIGQVRCVPGKILHGVNGYVPIVRADHDGLSMELKAEAPTKESINCNFCGTAGHKAMECGRKSVVEGKSVYPLAYRFKKGLATKWGLPTEKAKQKKDL